MSWHVLPSHFTDLVEADLIVQQKSLAVQALGQIIRLSPVDKGTYRGNHLVTIDEVTDAADMGVQDQSGDATLATGQRVIASIRRPFGVVVIQNSLPYAERLEHGHSDQAPAGVYSTAIANLPK